MIDKKILNNILTEYKKDFVDKWWEDEKYKWEAVKCFQDNWDINAEDFAGMLKTSLSGTKNLLVSAGNFPAKMITSFAKKAPEEVRAMFMDLFNEAKEIYNRILSFKNNSAILLEKYGENAKQHYQYENSISVYLWLRYPDKYCIYKYGEVKRVTEKLKSNYQFIKGHYANNIRNFYRLYDELCEDIQQDTELIELLKSQLTENCYPDPEYRTLTVDVGYYISRCYGKKDSDEFKNVYPSVEESAEYLQVAENGAEKDKTLSHNDAVDTYTEEDFLSEVYMTKDRYYRLKNVLQYKKNIILQGAPGVGKTFTAKRLAYAMMGEKDENKIKFIQFHQNYSYEDFIMGYKPSDEGFELTYGVFYLFCQKAASQPDKNFFFIIDEINRGNISKIFGELLMLIEKDYRGKEATMAYNNMTFSVPDNLYIIGMMNTADRSLAMIDYALRRRFSFFEMEPGFDSDGFDSYQNALHNETFDELIQKIRELNADIRRDPSLGKGFCIGHSYFCGMKNPEECTEEWMESVVDYDILPMLEEYWFDDESKLQRWENILHGVFQ